MLKQLLQAYSSFKAKREQARRDRHDERNAFYHYGTERQLTSVVNKACALTVSDTEFCELVKKVVVEELEYRRSFSGPSKHAAHVLSSVDKATTLIATEMEIAVDVRKKVDELFNSNGIGNAAKARFMEQIDTALVNFNKALQEMKEQRYLLSFDLGDAIIEVERTESLILEHNPNH